MDTQSSNEILSIKNMKFANFNVLSSRYFVIISLFIIGFVISETSIVIAQESRNKTISLIPLNSTEIELGIDKPGFEIDKSLVINIDNQKFWKFFDPLLEYIN
jgi:hypothetical protein